MYKHSVAPGLRLPEFKFKINFRNIKKIVCFCNTVAKFKDYKKFDLICYLLFLTEFLYKQKLCRCAPVKTKQLS